MTPRSTRILTQGAFGLMLAVICSTATAGIEPSPFKVVLVNRSDVISPASPYYGQMIQTADVYIQAVTSTGQVIELRKALVDELPTGATFVANVDPQDVAGSVTLTSLLSWRITARMGVDPSPFKVYAMDARSPTVAEPVEAPWYDTALLSEQLSLYAFSSPGTLVGSATISNDVFYDACPITDAWNNHGQYVRCVALRAEELLSQGLISQEDADAAVSGAARSTVGK